MSAPTLVVAPEELSLTTEDASETLKCSALISCPGIGIFNRDLSSTCVLTQHFRSGTCFSMDGAGYLPAIVGPMQLQVFSTIPLT